MDRIIGYWALTSFQITFWVDYRNCWLAVGDQALLPRPALLGIKPVVGIPVYFTRFQQATVPIIREDYTLSTDFLCALKEFPLLHNRISTFDTLKRRNLSGSTYDT